LNKGFQQFQETEIFSVDGEVKPASSRSRMVGHIMTNTTSYWWVEYVSALWSYDRNHAVKACNE